MKAHNTIAIHIMKMVFPRKREINGHEALGAPNSTETRKLLATLDKVLGFSNQTNIDYLTQMFR